MNNKQAWHAVSVLQGHIAGLRLKVSNYNKQALEGNLSVINSIANAQLEIIILEEIIATLSAQAQEFVQEITAE